MPAPRRIANAKPKWISVVPVPADAPPPPAEHFKLGKPSATWTYTDATGAVLGYVLRFDGAEAQTISAVDTVAACRRRQAANGGGSRGRRNGRCTGYRDSPSGHPRRW